MYRSWAVKQAGFTIVELLIVIVVIAILAAISVVAYNGVQIRAENSKTINGVAAYTKIFSLYAADKGEYPIATNYPCLGNSWSGTCGRVTAGSPGCGYSGSTSVETAFNTQLANYATTVPAISAQTMNCNGEVYKGVYVNKNDTNTKNLNIVMHLKGTVDCPTVLGSAKMNSSQQSDQVTRCAYNMPSL